MAESQTTDSGQNILPRNQSALYFYQLQTKTKVACLITKPLLVVFPVPVLILPYSIFLVLYAYFSLYKFQFQFSFS